MKIMTFNIQHALDYRNQVIDTDLFARTIRRLGADVCGLNEVRDAGSLEGYTDQTGAIGESLGFHHYFGEAIRVGGDSPYGNALVSRYPIREAETFLIPEPSVKVPGRYYERRCVIRAVLDVEGRDIAVFVCHMGLSGEEQEQAVKRLCALVDACPLPLVVMGDFNARPDAPVLAPLLERLEDTAALVGEEHLFTFASYAPDRKIDYLLYRGLTCLAATTVEEVVSDHFPIIATFQ